MVLNVMCYFLETRCTSQLHSTGVLTARTLTESAMHETWST